MLFYRIVRWIVAGGSALTYRARIVGREHLPDARRLRARAVAPFDDGHPVRGLAHAAAVALHGQGVAVRRARAGLVLPVLGGFPVQRDGTDRKALRDSIDMLHDGDMLLVYPEGTRQNGAKIQPLQPGAAYLALRAGVPILPVGIAGTEEILRDHRSLIPHFAPVTIVVGEPIISPPRDKGVVPRAEVDALTARLHDTCRSCSTRPTRRATARPSR